MLARISLCLAVIAATAAVAHAQPGSGKTLTLPEPCRGQPAEKLSVLESRRSKLERAIAKAQTAGDAAAAKDAAAKSLTSNQERLLEVLFQIDCAKARLRVAAARRAPGKAPGGRPLSQGAPESATEAMPSAAPDPGPPPSPPTRSLRDTATGLGSRAPGKRNAIEVTTYFATNRGRTASTDPETVYDATVSSLSYGRAVVSIPSTHTPGSLELPSIWRLQFQADPKRHFILKAATPLDFNDARAEMARRLESTKTRSLLIFVHGYNMSFSETAMRTAQLAYDLRFPGIPFFFSWPSAGQVTGYMRDAESAQLSEDAFDRVLDDLAVLPVTDVYVIAHSMGSRVVSQVLRSRVDKGKPAARLSELLLAAPDINVDLFRTVIAPRLKALQGTQTTVYASSTDLALRASKAVHGYRRVGETAGGVFVYPGMETVDASNAAMAVRAFGHSYLTDSAAVLKDIQSIVRQKLSAKQRGLSQAGASPNFYWSLR